MNVGGRIRTATDESRIRSTNEPLSGRPYEDGLRRNGRRPPGPVRGAVVSSALRERLVAPVRRAGAVRRDDLVVIGDTGCQRTSDRDRDALGIDPEPALAVGVVPPV